MTAVCPDCQGTMYLRNGVKCQACNMGEVWEESCEDEYPVEILDVMDLMEGGEDESEEL